MSNGCIHPKNRVDLQDSLSHHGGHVCFRCIPNAHSSPQGNAGRYINHCCDPNCYCRVVTVDGIKHIVLFAWRDVKANEEITYDYKLPIEDVKIICHCGAATCRGYLN